VRVTASLVDPRTAEQLWANDYDRELSAAHIFTIRSDVAREVAGALDLTFSPSDEERLGSPPTESLEAYQSFQLGRFFWNKRTPQALETAVGHYQRAIELDPDYALAYAGLADIYVVLPWFDNQIDIPATLARAEAAAKRALELDPSLGEAVTALALVRESELDWKGAEIEFRRALELSPNHATAHHWYANLLSRLGHHEAALSHIKTALDLDPLSLIINQDLGYNLHLDRQIDAAIEQYRRALALDESFPPTRLVLALALLEAGRFQESAQEIERWSELTARDPTVTGQLVDLSARYAETGEAPPLPAGLDLESLMPPWSVAMCYMLIGQDERALNRLEQLYERGITWELMLVVGPAFDRLRDDPRFRALVDRIGLEA
jgi:tetratricopeptide (TPR) repeat protein